MSGMDILFTVLVGVVGIGGCLIVLGSSIAMFRARDALSRINVFSPVTGLGMPMILVAAYVHSLWAEGFSVWRTFATVVAFLALIAVSSVASNVLSRATFVSGSPVSRATVPNSKLAAQAYREAKQAERDGNSKPQRDFYGEWR